jgi:hypothetical protein
MQNEVSSHSASDTTTANEEVTSLNLSGRNVPGINSIAEGYRSQSQSGARWFFWIAALSMINSIVILANGHWNFLAGLGITQFISGLAVGLSEQLGTAATVIAVALDLMVALIFVSLGLFAQKRHTWAFILGMVIYGLDGLIFLLVQDWLAIAFHAFVLYGIYRGLSANLKLSSLEAEGLAPA